ncbi:adenosylcobinamide-GDP ribazoletransferase [uncultured Martelella sp.]|uniref:adenosylcobinamide-GDP ribazoletransferase n=1 Tax=uncultured Martelella sp. TaxID=392331 RepID=UPI0029C83381|nr:adenosylcobinamide-GDP ribazoletransferase [uncultured Martelella sp.]
MTRWNRVVTDLATATGFLTRYPLPAGMQTEQPEGARAAWAFPLVASLAMVLPALVLVLFSALGAGPLLSTLSAIATSLLVTGGLHEDGLADSADGLFGGRTRDDVLAIMKDSRTGAYGTLALVLSITLRATALAMLVAKGPENAALLFIAAAAAGRAVMVRQWYALPLARADGVAATLGRPDKNNTLCAAIISLVIVALASALAGELVPALFALVALAVSAYAFTFFVRRRIGGHTGDTLGAIAQIGETVFLIALVILV